MKFFGAFSKKKILTVIFLAVAIGLAIVFFLKFGSNFSKDAKDEISSLKKDEVTKKKSSQITAMQIKAEDIDIYEIVVGSIYNFNSAEISSEVTGLVEQVNVELGDYVKSGQILAIINGKELINDRDSQSATVKQLQAQLNSQQKTYNRYLSLFKDGFVSQAELDTAKVNLDTLRQQLSSARSVLSNINIKLSKANIRSKISGVIQARTISEGNFVSIGTNLFSVVDNSSLLVIANFPESYLGSLKKGQEVLLRPSGTDVMIKSQIKEIKPVIDSLSRTIQIIIEIKDNKYNLKPGGTVSVSVLMEHKKGAIFVPEESIVLRAKGKVVYIIQSGIAKEVSVKTGISQSGKIEIKEGLSVGETLAVVGAGFLDNNTPVTIQGQASSESSNTPAEVKVKEPAPTKVAPKVAPAPKVSPKSSSTTTKSKVSPASFGNSIKDGSNNGNNPKEETILNHQI